MQRDNSIDSSRRRGAETRAIGWFTCSYNFQIFLRTSLPLTHPLGNSRRLQLDRLNTWRDGKVNRLKKHGSILWGCGREHMSLDVIVCRTWTLLSGLLISPGSEEGAVLPISFLDVVRVHWVEAWSRALVPHTLLVLLIIKPFVLTKGSNLGNVAEERIRLHLVYVRSNNRLSLGEDDRFIMLVRSVTFLLLLLLSYLLRDRDILVLALLHILILMVYG